jgi:hypothetical protein
LAVERLAERLEQAEIVIDDALAADVEIGIRLRAAIQVFDRVLGKPTQAVEITGDDDGPVEFEHRGVSLADIMEVARAAGL